MGGWIETKERQPGKYGKYRILRRVGKQTREDEYLWNGGYWVTKGNSISKAVVSWYEEAMTPGRGETEDASEGNNPGSVQQREGA